MQWQFLTSEFGHSEMKWVAEMVLWSILLALWSQAFTKQTILHRYTTRQIIHPIKSFFKTHHTAWHGLDCRMLKCASVICVACLQNSQANDKPTLKVQCSTHNMSMKRVNFLPTNCTTPDHWPAVSWIFALTSKLQCVSGGMPSL